MDEISVVLVKPDGVRRRLIGEIISRFEKTGLELIACKMVVVPEELAMDHYGQTEEWYLNIGEKFLKFYNKHGLDPEEELGAKEPKEIGKVVHQWNIDYLTAGPVVAMIWRGVNAVQIVRKIVGPTFPRDAQPGTIRGDYSYDSPMVANTEKRSIHNIVHASGAPEEAEFERKLWFKEDEIYD